MRSLECYFLCFLPSLVHNSGNKHQNNPLVRHSNTYIILYFWRMARVRCPWTSFTNRDYLNRIRIRTWIRNPLRTMGCNYSCMPYPQQRLRQTDVEIKAWVSNYIPYKLHVLSFIHVLILVGLCWWQVPLAAHFSVYVTYWFTIHHSSV